MTIFNPMIDKTSDLMFIDISISWFTNVWKKTDKRDGVIKKCNSSLEYFFIDRLISPHVVINIFNIIDLLILYINFICSKKNKGEQINFKKDIHFSSKRTYAYVILFKGAAVWFQIIFIQNLHDKMTDKVSRFNFLHLSEARNIKPYHHVNHFSTLQN